MCTDVITHMLCNQGAWVINYLDDYIGVSTPDKTESHYLSLLNVLRQVGLPVNEKKVGTPGTKITCLGILIDTKEGILAIPEQKMAEIKKLCKVWLNKKFASKKQV